MDKDRLWEKVRNFAITVANNNYKRYELSYRRIGYTLQDMQSEAYIGFIDALAEYDPADGRAFEFVLVGTITDRLRRVRHIDEDIGSQSDYLEDKSNCGAWEDLVCFAHTADIVQESERRDMLQDARRQILLCMAECLTPEQREAVMLRYFRDEDWYCIAVHLNKRRPVTQRIVYSALKAMRRYDASHGRHLYETAIALGVIDPKAEREEKKLDEQRMMEVARRWR